MSAAGARSGLLPALIVFAIAELATATICGRLFIHFFNGETFFLPADLARIVTHGAIAAGRLQAAPDRLELFLYPPTILLLGAPLSLLSAGAVFILWSMLGIGLFYITGRQLRMSSLQILFALLLPPSLYCLTLGQTGLMLSALFVLSLCLAPRHPIRSGLIAGLMVLKPQAALLLPICYIAMGQTRAILAAAVSALSFCAITFLVFGPQPWVHFYAVSLPEARQVLQAPWHLNNQNIMVSPFMLLRSLGAGLRLAYAVQSAATLLGCWLTWRLWRKPEEPGLDTFLITTCLAALATPYMNFYDLPGICLLLAANWPRQGWKNAAALGFVLGTGCYVLISVKFFLTGTLFITALCIAYWPRRENFPRSRSGLSHSGSQT